MCAACFSLYPLSVVTSHVAWPNIQSDLRSSIPRSSVPVNPESCSEGLRSNVSSVSKILIMVVVQSRLRILGIHATVHRLFSASILIVPPAVLRSLIHGYRLSPHYLVTLSPLSLSASFNRAHTFWSIILLFYRSRHSTAVLRFLPSSPLSTRKLLSPPLTSIPSILSLPSRTTPPSSQFLKSSSRFLDLILPLFILIVVVYIYVTNHSIQASQELGP